jgi:hypothetical protein
VCFIIVSPGLTTRYPRQSMGNLLAILIFE